ncbi:hypothetical protein [Sphingomonas adhaesiva]|uniref:hypothetical protein n=1 Tax=Sphingomonas adhaesiva TaxID=28212 RepID=UPI002FFCD004
MVSRDVAGIVAAFVVFLRLSGKDIVDPVVAAEAIQELAPKVRALDRAFLRELVDAFPVIALDYDEESKEVVRNIPRDFGLEEALAVDD